MSPFENLLQTLAVRGPATNEADSEQLREKVASSLEPMIRRVLQRGVGLPGLVQWVRRTLPGLGEGERTAPAMARRLCANLVRQTNSGDRVEAGRETIVM